MALAQTEREREREIGQREKRERKSQKDSFYTSSTETILLHVSYRRPLKRLRLLQSEELSENFYRTTHFERFTKPAIGILKTEDL